MTILLRALFTCIALLAGGRPAHAHYVGQSYVYLQVTETALGGRFEVNLKDVARMLPLDVDGDGKVSVEEYDGARDAVGEFLRGRLLLRDGDREAQVELTGTLDVLQTEAGDFIRHTFVIPELSPPPASLDVRFDALWDDDTPNHLGMVLIENNVRTGVEGNEAQPSALYRKDGGFEKVFFDPEPFGSVFQRFVGEGTWHIWIGLDHILFIIALLLPSVLLLDEGRWRPTESFGRSLWYVAKVATLFTIAHSVTLSLASLDIVRLPSSPIEAMIALSIAVTAYGNLRPYLEGRAVWFIIFGFGLFHGFGFASVLAPLGLTPSTLVAGLLGFNVGVELGQLAVIAAVFPALYLLRRTPIYRPMVLHGGSLILIAISLFWFVERSLHVWNRARELGYV